MDNLNNESKHLEEYLRSYWIKSTERTNYPTLEDDIYVDVAIIGGGIVGVTSAFLLKQHGVRVALIDANRIGEGATGFTTAKITSQHHFIYDKLINTKGTYFAKQYADANEKAISFIEFMTREYNIDCDFERLPAYMYTRDENYLEAIDKEAEAALRLGISARTITNMPLDINIKSAVMFENQAQFHPRKYILSLAKEIPGDGSYIFENSPVVDIDNRKPVEVITRSGKMVVAPKVIIASHFPCYDGMGFYLARLRPQRSYAVGIETEELFPKATFINAESPGRSLRAHTYDGNKQIVIIGGDGHKVAHGDSFEHHYDNLLKFARSNFRIENILYKWSTQDYITLDSVPYIGNLTQSKDNIYVATGLGLWGMTNGTTAARILVDKILNRDNPWEEIFSPSRDLDTTAYKSILVENTDVAKELLISKLKSEDHAITLAKGEGKVVKLHGNKYGAYRDDEDKVHLVDITCTHVGCELKWNDGEKSWDCPCHGSRFSYDGEILEGPAVNKLHHYKEGSNKIEINLV